MPLPTKTYRGTWDELMRHRSEIAPMLCWKSEFMNQKPRQLCQQKMPPRLRY